ncbi:MAG: chitobiase/beta-hexosaminidase C-terminal domain-containing protein, partial [Kiritimatiellae bacterium]|nr:chitobiase/beta-hexosaminidase C-terminal domain-containing protein [Kiritimatiellia bacterium]
AVAFSEPHGYKTAAFDLELSCPDAPTAQIYYTLDGSSPTTASTPYTGAIRVDRTTVVRAAVPVENTILQFDTSATYIFLDDVLAQARSTTAPASAVGFPDDNAVNNQEMLYGMEQSIVTGDDRERLLRGFTNSIATLSIVVDPANLFNSTTGIYVNPRGEGETWERQIMLEGFDPTGVGADFAQPAGLRLRGGNSRSTGKPKHSLRFFFRSSYGESSLAAKMFVGEPLSPNGEGKMKEEIGEYDKLDLRTSQNLSWANENSGNDTFVTEVFSRDSQRDLGQPYTRSRYYNLFINGQYWGLYQTQERGDEHWGEAYLGGDSLQYDLIKTASTYVNNRLSYSIECNEGTWDAWSNLWHIATQEGFGEGHEANYNKVLGLNPDGTRNPAYPILLNAESLMVYMLVSHYVVDQDGPTSPFSSIDKGHANNFYAIRNRDDAGAVKGFVFLRHDAEMSMGQNGNTGASQNPTLWGTEAQTSPTVGSPDPTGLGNQKFRTIPYFTPAELHYLLMQNPVYKRQYADLFYRECLREGGAMTVENATARYTSRMAEIDDAIVCEAARWGKSKNRS